MRNVEVEDFAACLDGPFTGMEQLLIKHHDQPVGVYLPFRRADEVAAALAADNLAAALEAIYTRTGIDEDALIVAYLADPPPGA
jgi:hypothetical protein